MRTLTLWLRLKRTNMTAAAGGRNKKRSSKKQSGYRRPLPVLHRTLLHCSSLSPYLSVETGQKGRLARDKLHIQGGKIKVRWRIIDVAIASGNRVKHWVDDKRSKGEGQRVQSVLVWPELVIDSENQTIGRSKIIIAYILFAVLSVAFHEPVKHFLCGREHRSPLNWNWDGACIGHARFPKVIGTRARSKVEAGKILRGVGHCLIYDAHKSVTAQKVRSCEICRTRGTHLLQELLRLLWNIVFFTFKEIQRVLNLNPTSRLAHNKLKSYRNIPTNSRPFCVKTTYTSVSLRKMFAHNVRSVVLGNTLTAEAFAFAAEYSFLPEIEGYKLPS